MPVDLVRIEEIFGEAVTMTDEAARAAYLDDACAGDVGLRQRVERLLAAHEATGNFLKLPAANGETSPYVPVTEGPKSKIGRYKLLEQIGEGGFGVVFMAEQEEPVRRLVALKIIKLGMDTRQVIARFEAERQALAMMDHPSVAKVLDGGATETGRPFFVMELVKGIPITEYCDRQQLSIPKRLELFSQVCQAVQHAHQKGLIHRDLKPTNVLVTTQDDRPVAKVIDFGVAKAMQARLTEKTLFTEFQQLVGTPAYMSPEQADGSLDIDTRSDVYSLGVMLYELLTGSTPFDPNELRSKAFAELQRIIREEEPPKPSTRLSTSDTLPSIAANRHTEPARLSREVRGELDWIVMKALEKDRKRRYETPSALARDIERYLNDEPVQACPPSAAYRFRKFARRNKTAVFAGLAILAALTTGFVVAAIGFVQARRQAEIARTQAATVGRINEYLQQMLGSANPEGSKGPDYKVRELLDDFGDGLDRGLDDQPEVAASLHATIGKAYWWLEERAKAKHHLARALELRRSLVGEEHELYADSLVDQAVVLSGENPTPEEFAARIAEVRKAMRIYQARGIGGRPVIHALWTLQLLYDMQHKNSEIESLVGEALTEAERFPDAANWELVAIKHGLINVKMQSGNYAEAERIAREAIATNTRLYGESFSQIGWEYIFLSEALRAQQKFKESLTAATEALTIMRKCVSPDHFWIGHSLERIVVALAAARDAHSLDKQIDSVEQLAEIESWLHQASKAKSRAADAYFEPVNVAIRHLPQFLSLYEELANEFTAANRTSEAETARKMRTALLAKLETDFLETPDMTAGVFAQHINILLNDHDKDRAYELCGKLLALKTNTGNAFNQVAWRLATDPDSDNRLCNMAIELAKRSLEYTPNSGNNWNTLGVAQYCAGQWDLAIDALAKSMDLRNGGDAFDWFFLAMAHWQLGHKVEASMWYDKAVEWMDKNQPKNEELIRFRTEAAELLGVAEPQTPAKPDSAPAPQP